MQSTSDDQPVPLWGTQVLEELAAVRGLLPLQAQGSLGPATRSRSSSLGAPRRSPRLSGSGR